MPSFYVCMPLKTRTWHFVNKGTLYSSEVLSYGWLFYKNMWVVLCFAYFNKITKCSIIHCKYIEFDTEVAAYKYNIVLSKDKAYVCCLMLTKSSSNLTLPSSKSWLTNTPYRPNKCFPKPIIAINIYYSSHQRLNIYGFSSILET